LQMMSSIDYTATWMNWNWWKFREVRSFYRIAIPWVW
jgi:hypothetical protein